MHGKMGFILIAFVPLSAKYIPCTLAKWAEYVDKMQNSFY